MIFNPGTGLAGGGTLVQADRLMLPFLCQLNVYPLHFERWEKGTPPEQSYPLKGYYDYRLARSLDSLEDCVRLAMPGVKPEQVICGDDYCPFTTCRVYVDGESFPWAGAIHIARRKLLKTEEKDTG